MNKKDVVIHFPHMFFSATAQKVMLVRMTVQSPFTFTFIFSQQMKLNGDLVCHFA